MTTELQLSLLGKLQIEQDSKPITGFVSTKVQALLSYLAVTGRPHDRQTLATLLWGEMPDAEAKANLRTALFNLRKLVAPYLIIDRQAIAFNRERAYRLDVEIFQNSLGVAGILEQSRPTGIAQASNLSLPHLRQAVELYRGDFLEGFTVREAPYFEEWLIGQRERLRQLVIQALHMLAIQHTQRGEYAAGIDYTTRLLAIEPWREEGHRQMMILLARSDQRSAALAQYETCRRILADELGVDPLPETTALYERLKAAGEPHSHNLPPQTTPFVGREVELARLTGSLQQSNCRLLSLVGPGGIGKTRLAVQAALQQLPFFQDGIFFVPLTAVNTEDLIIADIIKALNLHLSGTASPKQQVLSYLKDKELLLLLDNFEHLLVTTGNGINLLVEILQATAQVKVLITSRERLNLREEWVIEVEGLAYPKEDWEFGRLEIGDWGQGRGEEVNYQSLITNYQYYSAVALFVQQAQRIVADFTLTAADAPAVVHICRLVDGMPLGLELAAGWVQFYSCAEIAQEIERNLDFLTSSLRNIPERHRSLRAVFEYSWGLLSEQEQRIFRQLSIFQGGFSREAFLQVVPAAALLDLAGLLNKSLLRHTASGRYEIHELLRHYAGEKLAEASAEERALLKDRHARYYAQYLRIWRQRFEQEPTPARLAELNAESDNIRRGWERAIEPDNSLTVAEINQYWYLGHLEQAGQLDQPTLTGLHPPDPSWDRGLELHTQGVLAYQQGQYDMARRSLEESLSLLQATDDRLYLARSKMVLAIIDYDAGQYEAAERVLRETLAEFKAQGEHRYRTYALIYLARIARALGQPVTGHEELQESVAISREIEDTRALAHGLKNLAILLHLTGQVTEAEQLLYESLNHYRAVDEPWGQATTLLRLGQVYRTLGRLQAAEAHWWEALAVSLPAGFSPIILETLVELAALALHSHPPQSSQPVQTIAVLAAVLNHPALTHSLRQRTSALLTDLKPHLSPEIWAAGQTEGRHASLEALAGEFLAETGLTNED